LALSYCLLRRKVREMRLCVDYRALNEITVQYSTVQ